MSWVRSPSPAPLIPKGLGVSPTTTKEAESSRRSKGASNDIDFSGERKRVRCSELPTSFSRPCQTACGVHTSARNITRDKAPLSDSLVTVSR